MLGAAFSAQLALLWVNSGQIQVATTAVDTTQALLDACSEDLESSVAAQWILSCVGVAQARLHLAAGSCTQAVLSCHAALEACQTASHAANSNGTASFLQDYINSSLAMAYLTRVECLRAEGSDSSEISQASKDALSQVDPSACTVFGAAALAGLLLAHEEVNLARLYGGSELSTTARVWGPGQFTAELKAANAMEPVTGSNENNSFSFDEETSALRWAGSSTLWHALLVSRSAPHVHRLAAAKLVPACAAAGFPHLASLLLHIGNGTTLQVQHELVQHARVRNAERRQRAGGNDDGGATAAGAAEALNVLNSGLDWDAIQHVLVGNYGGGICQEKPKLVKRGSRRGAAATAKASSKSAENSASATPAQICAALSALDTHAQRTLNKWLSALPQGTVVCTVGSSQLSTAHRTTITGEESKSSNTVDCLVLSRIAAEGAHPLILEVPIKPYGGTASSAHPIRALALDAADDAVDSSSTDSVGFLGSNRNKAVISAVEEMARIWIAARTA